MQNLSEIIRSRRAIRRYADRPVARELIETLLETAVWAPSAHNRQPWRFAVLTAAEDKLRLAQAMGARLRADRAADGDPLEAIERDAARSLARISGAPVVIVLCLSMADMDVYLDTRRRRNEVLMAVQSVAMAAQNLWLLAHAAGLGACWLCAPLFAPAETRAALALPDDWEPQGLLTLGWPAEQKEKARRPWQASVKFL